MDNYRRCTQLLASEEVIYAEGKIRKYFGSKRPMCTYCKKLAYLDDRCLWCLKKHEEDEFNLVEHSFEQEYKPHDVVLVVLMNLSLEEDGHDI